MIVYVRNKNNNKLGKVIEVNKKWKWMSVKYEDGTTFKYNDDTAKRDLILMTQEERADYYLKMESAGITDYWSEE